MNKFKYLFADYPWNAEISVVLRNSSPFPIKRLALGKIKADFDYGEFVLPVKNPLGKEFQIYFSNGKSSINDFWKFLETVVETTEPLIFPLFYKGFETFLYVETVDKNNIRFMAADTFDLCAKQKEGKILNYSYAQSKIRLDVIIKRKEFISAFYTILFKLFKNYENIAYFEPPYTDFDFWIKDSAKLSDYLNRKKQKLK